MQRRRRLPPRRHGCGALPLWRHGGGALPPPSAAWRQRRFLLPHGAGNPRMERLTCPEEIGAESNPSPEEAFTSEISYARDYRREICLAWVEDVEEAREEGDDDDMNPPPVFIVLFRDLLQTWGWGRLVPYECGSVGWPDFKRYLEDYFGHNAGEIASLSTHQKPEPVGQGVAAEYNALHAAANLCIEIEDKLLRSYRDDLTTEGISLSSQIKDRAWHIIQSEVEPPAALAALVCITNEAELMCETLKRYSNTTREVFLSNRVRQSASNLMLYEGSEFAPAAAAMMGIAKEAKSIIDSWVEGHPDALCDYFTCDMMRKCTEVALTKLEKEIACKTAGNENGSPIGDTSEKPIGVNTARGPNCEGVDSVENSKKDMNEHSAKDDNLKLNKLNDQAERNLMKEKRKLKKEKRELKKRLKELKKRPKELKNNEDNTSLTIDVFTFK